MPNAKTNRIIVVQGGQYGSESKGLITAKMCHDRRVDWCVRTGTVNAGHTCYYKGKAHKMQQLPVGWVHPETKLVIGAGAYIYPEILEREIAEINEAMPEADVRDRLYIDYRAGLHLPDHTDRATAANRHHKMGATGKGCSEAVIDKIRGRGDDEPHTFKAFWQKWLAGDSGKYPGQFADTVVMLNDAYDRGETILIEGTQGTLLDLHLGPYPYTTHKQTQAANWMAECGLSVTLPVELVLVMRSHPIRVAGNSGPLPGEVSWTDLGTKLLPGYAEPVLGRWCAAVNEVMATMHPDAPQDRDDPAYWTQEERAANRKAASEIHTEAWALLSEGDRHVLSGVFEMTTVTRKLRRIAEWDKETARTSIMLNRPSSVALTFLNYVFPAAWDVTRVTFGQLPFALRERILQYVEQKRGELRCPISYIGFGPLEDNTFELYADELSGRGGVC